MKSVCTTTILLILVLFSCSDSDFKIVEKTAYITNPIGVDLMNERDANAASVGSIPFLEQVKWLGSIRNDKMYQIEWNRKKGWISGDVLSLEYPDKSRCYFNYLQNTYSISKLEKVKPNAWAKKLHESAFYEYKNKNIPRAEDLWFQASLKSPDWGEPYYNLACMASLQKKSDVALEYLKYAVGRDIMYFQYFKTDSDLEFLQSHPDFIKFCDETELSYIEEVLGGGVWVIAGTADEFDFHGTTIYHADNQLFFKQLANVCGDIRYERIEDITEVYRINQYTPNKLVISNVGLANGYRVDNPKTITLDKIQPINLIPYRKADKWGYCKKTDKEIIVQPQYDWAYPLREGLGRICLDGKWGFINAQGREVVPPKYKEADDFNEGQARVCVEERWGYIDKAGRELIPLRSTGYDVVTRFSEGLAVVYLGDKAGFVDKNSSEVIPRQFDGAEIFSEGLAAVTLHGKMGYVDKKGLEVISIKYSNVNPFREGLAVVEPAFQKGFGYIDKTDREIVPPRYDWASDFSEGLAAIQLGKKCGYIDKTGREVTPLKYHSVWDFSEGLGAVAVYFDSGIQVGFVNKNGREVIPPKYDSAGQFSEGLAAVEQNCQHGYIDNTGKEVIPLIYNAAWDFYEGLAMVQIGDKCGFIDYAGRQVIPLKYSAVEGISYSFSEGLAKVNLDGRWGYVDENGVQYWE